MWCAGASKRPPSPHVRSLRGEARTLSSRPLAPGPRGSGQGLVVTITFDDPFSRRLMSARERRETSNRTSGSAPREFPIVSLTLERTTGSGRLRGRRGAAVLFASIFLFGALTSVRSCPHHDAPRAGQAEQQSVPIADGHEGHGYSSDRSGDLPPGVPHACLCVDLCQIGGTPRVTTFDSRVAVFPVERASHILLPEEDDSPRQPTRHLIPLANAPPFIA